MHRRLLAVAASLAVAFGALAPSASALIYKPTMQPPSCDMVNAWGVECDKLPPPRPADDTGRLIDERAGRDPGPRQSASTPWLRR